MIALYMDHNVPRAVTVGLRLRGVDVITAYEDGADDMDDSALLDRATEPEPRFTARHVRKVFQGQARYGG